MEREGSGKFQILLCVAAVEGYGDALQSLLGY